MLANAVKSGCGGLHDFGRAILTCALKDGSRIGYSVSVSVSVCSRSFHRLVRQPPLAVENGTLKELRSHFCLVPRRGTAAAQCLTSANDLSFNDKVQAFLQKHNVLIKGENCPSPVLTIEEANFPDRIKDALKKQNIVEPTPIQSVTWPVALAGRNFVGISPTGSGKTLGFILPAAVHVLKRKALGEKTTSSPFVLVLAPTRELAQQINDVVLMFRSGILKSVCVFGGANRSRQISELKDGADVCIATPGRCLDMLSCGAMDLDRCSFLVLDEADHMLDMGFLPQIEEIITMIKCERQVLMWSATWPMEIRDIARRFLSTYIHLMIGSGERKPNPNVKQVVVVCKHEVEKKERLISILKESLESRDQKILIFAERKIDVVALQRFIRGEGIRCKMLHGDMSQSSRDIAMNGFRTNMAKVMVATAVAARGIDVSDITHVINYDAPPTLEAYIHKVGRTARHLKTGLATTLVTPDCNAGYLVDVLTDCNQPVPEELYDMARGKQSISKFSHKRESFGKWRFQPKQGFRKGKGRQDW